MAVRSYTKVTIDEVMKLYRSDLNFSQIARELGCCRNTVRRRVSEHITKTGEHVYISSKPYKNGFSSDILCDMHYDGLSVAQIASRSGFSKSYIYKVLKDYTNARR